ncbi:MAG TPA: ribonuclease H-like domain-containing protein, partial [Polyangiaceae bacterium]|nr:ribonuclease H-like domain-containing protein [Polyangiaceae bacterium]
GAEQPLLERIAERVAAASLIISFNGKAFDRPMLDGRAVLNRLPALPLRPHLDLLHVGRRLHRQRLGRCTLKRLELDVLGFDRGDDIDGSEVGPIYAHFLRTADAAGLAAVVAHNYWDVLSMVALVGLYGQRTPPLVGQDLAGLARTLKRAGSLQQAERVAEMACRNGGGVEAYRVRAELAKARGDCSGAVRDFERLCEQADDPRGRLELAKLYEHELRQPADALRWLQLGTNETFADQAKRRERLQRKLRRTPGP